MSKSCMEKVWKKMKRCFLTKKNNKRFFSKKVTAGEEKKKEENDLIVVNKNLTIFVVNYLVIYI